ncbi:hypothetical protein ACVIHF_001558 [Bradyrhizobium sp. USDA 4506]
MTSPVHNTSRGVWIPAFAGTTPGKEPWARISPVSGPRMRA